MDYIETLFTPKLVQELEDVSKSVETLMTSPDFMNFLKLANTRILVDNPAVSFVNDVKNNTSMFDTLDDDEYEALLHKVESASEAFHNMGRVQLGPNTVWQTLNRSLSDVISDVQALLHIKALADLSKETIDIYRNYQSMSSCDEVFDELDGNDWDFPVDSVQSDDVQVSSTEVLDDAVPDVPVTNDDSDLAEFI